LPLDQRSDASGRRRGTQRCGFTGRFQAQHPVTQRIEWWHEADLLQHHRFGIRVCINLAATVGDRQLRRAPAHPQAAGAEQACKTHGHLLTGLLPFQRSIAGLQPGATLEFETRQRTQQLFLRFDG
jgi:hypothetical protein